ncbi:plasminogen activator inhibitor 1 RNA-binding protein isoform X1 [Oncorhynchus kisutch]|uniref:plasminogen activator inhibitor 1 RNA-binding protein isoform X1 n=1 Tax=Oncorhynchus kisutch TaxID=8019 RepID=UPI0012DC5E5A|nr:plasminogen activator inhibitor 1 RNA-binding protein-like isoform X1 [Oncorhynchus kisutch]
MPGHMQEGFGCAIANRFDQLFDDESDPFELLKEAENKKKEAPVPGAAKTAAQAAKLQKKESQKDRKMVPADKKDEPLAPVPLKKDGPGPRRMGRRPEGQGPAGGPPREFQGEGRPPTDRPPRTDRRPPRRFERPPGGEEKPGEGGEFSVEKPIGERPLRGRGGGRGRGLGSRGRGMGRSDGFDARGKREFDRHSGNDRSSQKGEEKRGGSGSHNWGTVKDEMGELDHSNVTEETPEGEEHLPADSENNRENEVGEPKEVEPKEMTLDEWKAQQDKEKTKVEFNIRKANEGADSQWKKGYVLHKSKDEKKDDTLIEAAVEAEGVAPKTEDDHHFRKPANDITAQLEINFGDLGRPSRGRGGPRGGRGGRGRGEGRGEFRGEFREREPREPRERDGGAPTRPARGGRTDKPSGVIVPNVDDPEAFPALA